jgi:acetyl esterase/lipase
MKKVKRGIVRLIGFSITSVVLLGSWMIYYLHQTDAPATHGEVDYHISYKEGLTLDVYHPTNEARQDVYPVLMYVHGGAWISGSKLTVNNNRFNGAFNQLRAAGYYIISPDYTLAQNGQTPFPDCIQDVFDAIQWADDNADIFKFDMNQLGLLGESAGGHLAMMTTFSEPSDFGLSHDKQPIQYLVDVYGPSNLHALYHAATTDSINALINRLPATLAERLDLSRLLVGFDPKDQPTKAEEIMHNLSPITYLDSENIPTLIIHGTNDQVVPIEQSYLLTSIYDSLSIPYEAHYFKGVNHAFQGATAIQKDSIQDLIVNFIKKQKRN